MSQNNDRDIARRGRIIATVIALSGMAAILAPFLVQLMGLHIRYEMLFYFGALAGFVWALVNIYHIWRRGQNRRG